MLSKNTVNIVVASVVAMVIFDWAKKNTPLKDLLG